MAGTPNAYVTLGVTLFVGVLSNLILPGETGYFKSTDYDDRLAQMKQE
jgi:hypothetical protein